MFSNWERMQYPREFTFQSTKILWKNLNPVEVVIYTLVHDSKLENDFWAQITNWVAKYT